MAGLSSEELWNEAEAAFINVMKLLAEQLSSKGINLPTHKLNIVDVGAGQMPYGLALERWARSMAKEVTLVAVDPVYSLGGWESRFYPVKPGSAIKQLALPLENASSALKGLGIEKIDLLTLFNPNPSDTPKVRSLDELCKGTPILGALDGPFSPDIDWEMMMQGYRVVNKIHNPSSRKMESAWGREYSPAFIALPRSFGQ